MGIHNLTEYISKNIIPLITLDTYAPNVAPWNSAFLNWYYLKKFMIISSEKFIKGICLDVGSGNSPYKKYLKNITMYISVDKNDTSATTYKNNTNMINADAKSLPFENNYADTILLNQVLEHIDDYEKVLTEIKRVLKYNGKCVISVPFIYHIHGEPNDYFRFSEYGLRYMLKKHGYKIIEYHYLGYAGTALVSIWNSFIWQVWNKNVYLKFLRNTVFLLPILVLFFINNIFGLILDLVQNKKFCPNYLVVCEKIDE
ncbi:class I SAM-dependent methyltransferase [Arcobacter sp. FWKO B]|uniref:class I SAM-dependent methyltransferase n=1 Tax=Arcobacter sp. FWKO B TaxID=2593672 RepID=UPI0018A69B8F|nr:class I SAM-dependent methyltransferase [Arcobacter sp. FWKO B]QOG12162.1 class I SAM-dependent methyltransferase [Arcobacter sp. FWKO B]